MGLRRSGEDVACAAVPDFRDPCSEGVSLGCSGQMRICSGPAAALVEGCIETGFRTTHLDASFRVGLSVVGATVCGMGPGEVITLMVDVGRGEETEVGFVLARKIRRVYMMVGLVRADIASLHADVCC